MQVPVGYNNSEIKEMVSAASVEATGEKATPTNRLLDGSQDHGYSEEWQEPARMPDGRACKRMYLFDDDDITWGDGQPRMAEDYPWDDEHVRRIVLID